MPPHSVRRCEAELARSPRRGKALQGRRFVRKMTTAPPLGHPGPAKHRRPPAEPRAETEGRSLRDRARESPRAPPRPSHHAQPARPGGRLNRCREPHPTGPPLRPKPSLGPGSWQTGWRPGSANGSRRSRPPGHAVAPRARRARAANASDRSSGTGGDPALRGSDTCGT